MDKWKEVRLYPCLSANETASSLEKNKNDRLLPISLSIYTPSSALTTNVDNKQDQSAESENETSNINHNNHIIIGRREIISSLLSCCLQSPTCHNPYLLLTPEHQRHRNPPPPLHHHSPKRRTCDTCRQVLYLQRYLSNAMILFQYETDTRDSNSNQRMKVYVSGPNAYMWCLNKISIVTGATTIMNRNANANSTLKMSDNTNSSQISTPHSFVDSKTGITWRGGLLIEHDDKLQFHSPKCPRHNHSHCHLSYFHFNFVNIAPNSSVPSSTSLSNKENKFSNISYQEKSTIFQPLKTHFPSNSPLSDTKQNISSPCSMKSASSSNGSSCSPCLTLHHFSEMDPTFLSHTSIANATQRSVATPNATQNNIPDTTLPFIHQQSSQSLEIHTRLHSKRYKRSHNDSNKDLASINNNNDYKNATTTITEQKVSSLSHPQLIHVQKQYKSISKYHYALMTLTLTQQQSQKQNESILKDNHTFIPEILSNTMIGVKPISMK